MAVGAACPVTRKLLKVSWNTLPLLQGDGPAALMIVPPSEGPVISVRESERDALGYVGEKTPWLVPTTYRGSLLIRGRRIDGSSPVRFAFGSGNHLTQLSVPSSKLARNRAHGWFSVPSSTLVKQAGCYGFQIDGATFSEHVIVRVTR
ncbi:MAG TPA: hypothetical protein VGI77_05970 [Gaiellaceae bacterium]